MYFNKTKKNLFYHCFSVFYSILFYRTYLRALTTLYRLATITATEFCFCKFLVAYIAVHKKSSVNNETVTKIWSWAATEAGDVENADERFWGGEWKRLIDSSDDVIE